MSPRAPDPSPAKTVARGDELLSAEEAAPLFGVKADTVRKWMREGAIPVVRSGPYKLPRIKRSTVDMFRTE